MTFNLNRILLLAALVALVPACAGTHPTAINYPGAWARTYGGGSSDLTAPFGSVIPVTNGYLITGRLANNALGWVIRLNLDGTVAWQKSYGSSGTTLMSVDAAPAGGFIFAASTTSLGAGNSDVWVVRLNDDGSIAWQKTYGGPGNDYAKQVRSTSDGGFIVLAGSDTFSGSVQNMWILKLNADGSIAWQKTLINAVTQYANGIREVPGGGYIVASQASIGASFDEALLLRLNSDGSVAWQKRYGTTNAEGATAVALTNDSGFVVSGSLYPTGAPGPTVGWVFKVDSSGALVWQKQYSSGTHEEFQSCEALKDGTFLLAGVQGNSAGSIGSQVWALALNADGSASWQKKYGGSQGQEGTSLLPSPYGGLILTGDTSSYGAGVYDLWALHLDADGVCGTLGVDTLATPVDTSATATTTTFVIGDTSITPANTAVLPVDTFYVSTSQVP
jgi:hypothetical protein